MYYYSSSNAPSIKTNWLSFNLRYVGNAEIILGRFLYADSCGRFKLFYYYENDGLFLYNFYYAVSYFCNNFVLYLANWSSSNTCTSHKITANANYFIYRYPSLTKYCYVVSKSICKIFGCNNLDFLRFYIYFLNI